MKRRAFITLLGGAAAWPLAARAQQGERMRRIGALSPLAADDPQSQSRMTAFVQGLQQLGWTAGRNVRIDTLWSAGDPERIRRNVAELVALAPDVILAAGSPAVAALLQATRTVPIVFATIVDPVGAGFVDSLAQPGGNATGFILYEYGLSAKWLELLKATPRPLMGSTVSGRCINVLLGISADRRGRNGVGTGAGTGTDTGVMTHVGRPLPDTPPPPSGCPAPTHLKGSAVEVVVHGTR